MAEKLEELVGRLEKVTMALEAKAGGGGGGQDSAAMVLAFDDFLAAHVKPVVALGKSLGDADLAKQLDAAEAAFAAQREFLVVVAASKKPDQSKIKGLLNPTTAEMDKVTNGTVRGDFFNHMKAVADSIPALGWVLVQPAPKGFVKEYKDAFMFYANKVLREFKEKDPKHVEFVNGFKALFDALVEYINNFHTTGLAWNPKGGDAGAPKAAAPAAAPAAPAASGGPTPPPPGPPPSLDDLPGMPSAGGKAASKPDTGAFLSELTSGNLTNKLKKVTDDMKTHKNPSLRAGGTVPAKEEAQAPKPAAAKPAVGAVKVKTPKFALEGKMWWVEHQVDNQEIVIDDTNKSQSVFISGCKDTVVQIKGKVNTITVENSTKTGVVFESVVASVDIINSKKVQLQCTDTVTSVNLDKTHDSMVYLSDNCKDAVLTCSLCSDINLFSPGATEDADMAEFAVPYQFQTRIVDGQLVTEPVRHE